MRLNQFSQRGMQVERLERRVKAAQQADREADATRCMQHVHATADTGQPARAIERTTLNEFRPHIVADQVARHDQQRGGGQRSTAHDQPAANPHGRWQSRLQVQIVLDRLSRRFPTLRLAGDGVVWKDGLGTRGLSRLPVRW